ncbi:uncharacterized protein PgNI_01571 [Pyricularia grisea]|uniref:Uncharacterized protein n=1 Tax=Pyricularia grisea TaxID=148305 RepID=A0A6P8BHF3_PYRGI|nr:uncharacterized protein PgNI_01571 [Pyricularia grisea]TLD16198.1 hypothetical protein PgNI_01571 [Pyricularia grisea]
MLPSSYMIVSKLDCNPPRFSAVSRGDSHIKYSTRAKGVNPIGSRFHDAKDAENGQAECILDNACAPKLGSRSLKMIDADISRLTIAESMRCG